MGRPEVVSFCNAAVGLLADARRCKVQDTGMRRAIISKLTVKSRAPNGSRSDTPGLLLGSAKLILDTCNSFAQLANFALRSDLPSQNGILKRSHQC